MSNEKLVELTEAERATYWRTEASTMIDADSTARLIDALDEERAKVARVEALAEELEADAERHRNAETLSVEDGARAYRAAVESAASAAAIRAALAEPERDEEGGR